MRFPVPRKMIDSLWVVHGAARLASHWSSEPRLVACRSASHRPACTRPATHASTRPLRMCGRHPHVDCMALGRWRSGLVVASDPTFRGAAQLLKIRVVADAEIARASACTWRVSPRLACASSWSSGANSNDVGVQTLEAIGGSPEMTWPPSRHSAPRLIVA